MVTVRELNEAERASIEATRQAYRDMWSAIPGDPPHQRFDGGPADIGALEFIEWEAGHHPQGLHGAAVIWAGVIEATGVLSWCIAGDSSIALRIRDYPELLILPEARVAETMYAASSPDLHYHYLLEKTVIELFLRPLEDSEKAKLAGLLYRNAYSRAEELLRCLPEFQSMLAKHGR
ncbi:MAG: hypothetical protein QM770_14025 [Tepidisphaeraceae bacterium]